MFERFRALTPTQQIGLVLAAALAAGGLLYAVYIVFLRQPYDVLFTDLPTADAAAIIEALDAEKTPYRLDDNGRTILVPRKVADATRISMSSSELPLKGAVGFELFNKSDMGLTEFAQRINYQRALQGELARTIMTIDGVESARVHLALAPTTIFRDDRQPSKASITVIAKYHQALPEAAVLGIQRLVAASVPELALGSVVVLDGRGQVLTPDAVVPVVFPAQDERVARIQSALAQSGYRPDEVLVELFVDPDLAGASGQGRQRTRVLVTVQRSLTGEEIAAIRDLVVTTAGLDVPAGDLVTVGSGPAAMPPASAPAPAPIPTRPAINLAPPKVAHIDWTALVIAVGLFLALVLAAAVIIRLAGQGRGPKRLTEVEKARFAAKLRTQIDAEEDWHAAA